MEGSAYQTGMAPNPNIAPVLFDRALLRARQARALRPGPATFLLDRVAEDMAERLHAVVREFKIAADVGTPGDQVRNALHQRVDQLARIELPDLESEPLPLQPESLDLVVSALALQFVNDLPGVLAQIRRALQQRTDIAQIGKRRDAGRDPAFAFGFRCRKGLPQFGQCLAADHRRQQQPIGFQRAADLRQHAGQIVDELKDESGNDEVERFRLAWERLRFEVRQLDPRESIDALVQDVADLIARRSDVGRILEFSHHRV